MKRILPLLLALVLAAPSARATTLVYEGFASTDYEAGKSINGKKSANASIGLDTANGWNSGTGVFTAQANGLALPDIWNDGTVHGTEDLRAVLYNTTSTSTTRDNRAQQRALTCTWPASGSLYFRFLMQVPKDALSTSYLGNWNYWIAGLGTEAIANPVSSDCNIANGIYMGVRNRNGTLEVAAYVKNQADGATFTKPLFTIDTSKTLRCACIAKIDIGENGNDTLSFYAAPTNTLTTDFEWTFTTNGISLVSGPAKPSYLQMIGHFKVNSQFITFDEFIVTDTEEEAYTHTTTQPRLRDGSLSLANGTYTATALLTNSAANVSYVLSNGTTATTNAIAAYANGDTVTGTFAAPTDDTTYEVLLVAENQGGEKGELSLGTIYGGTLSLTKVSDANELGLAPATLTVSRASADPLPLVVNYAFADGTAVAGLNYVDDAGSVMIPAGQASATIAVHPLVDVSTAADTAMSVSLAAGNYSAPAAVSVTIANFTTPAGQNYWVGGTATDGAYLASTAANWSAGHAPLANENVVFDGNFSNADCEWDAGATATVASWTQTNGYTGTVTVDTVFPEKGAFTVLTVSGDMAIRSGTVTHRSHDAANKVDTYRLRIDVGGNLTVASGAKITARAKGSYGPRSTGESAYGGSYNGNSTWGSVTEPYGIGSSANDNGTYTCFGGGAIWIEVAGATTLDGSINANGIETLGKWDTHAGSGGAVYLKTATLSGSGKISADCESTGRSSNHRSAAGGRVSVLLTSCELTSFSDANITALAGNTSYGHVGGTGTVLVRTPQKPNGVLYLRDRSGKYGQFGYRPMPNQLTRIPAGQTWVVDGIVFGDNAILQVPTGTTLDLRGGLASISSTGNTLDETGLIVDGGTLLLPSAATHVISGKWIFEPKDFALDGNLVVTNGAGVGTLLLYSTTSNEVRTCGLSVSGDAHVASGSYLRAVRGGYIATGAATVGGSLTSCHGGTRAASTTASRSYDSFFHPRHPGAFGADNGLVNVGGGAIRLAVGGTLTLDGVAIATPSVNNARCGGAGSIDITAARLEGAGRIEANGNSRNYQAADSSSAGGGGRVAVRLTGAGATFSDAWIAKINAKGYYSSKITAEFSSSAGSVYLQTGSQSEGAGTVIVRNTGDTANNIAVTELPSLKAGGEADDFRKASLSVEAAARVQLFADLKMAKLDMAAGTVLDLNGHKFTVTTAHVGGENVQPGTYAAGDAAVAGFVIDTADGAGGTLRVLGAGTVLIVR